MRWLLGSVVWALVACGTSNDSGVTGAGSAGNLGSAGTSSDAPRRCISTSAACTCDGGLEGHEECDTNDEVFCNCDAPVQKEPLLACVEPCEGNLTGDWQLVDVCTPRWAKGNCEHPVHDATVDFSPSGLAQSDSGIVMKGTKSHA
jgi:hypothetical protein